MLCFDFICVRPHTDRRLNNGDIYQASATGSAHRSGWLRKTHRGQFNSSPDQPETNKLRIILDWPCCLCDYSAVFFCTSRVSAGVDWQVLGYSPQDLLLGLFPIFPLQ